MITFTQVHENSPVKVIVEISEFSNLPEVIDAVKQFLLGCGYPADQVEDCFKENE